MIKDQSLQALFDAYEKAFSALDTEKTAGFFADAFISAGPQGAIAQSKAEFLSMARQAAEFYRKVGQTSAKIISAEELRISQEYTMVKVHWGVTFEKTGAKLVEFDVSYIVYRATAEPRIILFIAHQDEKKAMQELGLTQNG